MTGMLIYKLKESAKRRAALRGGEQKPTPSGISIGVPSMDAKSNVSDARSKADAKAKATDDQTSHALLAIVILFLVCEVPIACTLLASLFDHDFFLNVVLRTYYLSHLLRLLNASLNFILYCIMSSLFRSTFVEVFAPTIRPLFGLASDGQCPETPVGSKATDSMELSSHSQTRTKPGANMWIVIFRRPWKVSFTFWRHANGCSSTLTL